MVSTSVWMTVPWFQGMCCYSFSFERKVSSAVSLIIAYFYICYSMRSNWTAVYIVSHDLPSRRGGQMSCCPGSGNLVEMRHTCAVEESGNRGDGGQRGWKPLKEVWQGWKHMESEVNSEGIYTWIPHERQTIILGCINDLCGSPASLSLSKVFLGGKATASHAFAFSLQPLREP